MAAADDVPAVSASSVWLDILPHGQPAQRDSHHSEVAVPRLFRQCCHESGDGVLRVRWRLPHINRVADVGGTLAQCWLTEDHFGASVAARYDPWVA